jgi:hypothetical protein
MNLLDQPIYTIGYGGRPISDFIDLLRQYGIRRLVDIRSLPTSRFRPDYRKAALQAHLEGAGIEYIFMESWTNWCEGFLGGQLWLLHEHTGDPHWRERRPSTTRRLIEHRKTDRNVHDLGFLFWPTWKRWYDHDRRPGLKQRWWSKPGRRWPALQGKGPVPALLPGRRQPVHRHYDERGHHLLRRPANP